MNPIYDLLRADGSIVVNKKSQDEYDKEWLESRRLRIEMKDLKPKDEQSDKLSLEILKYWNSKGIIVHRKYSDRTPRILSRITKEFSKEEILQAIDNYSTVYNDEKYYFNYKWDLETFLQKSNTLPTFMNDGSKWLSYLEVMIPKPKKKELIIHVAEQKEKRVIASDNFHFTEETYSMIINSLNLMPYEEYLQTEHWLHFKAEALKSSLHKCRVCNVDDVILHVHHNNYSNRGRETFNDVIVLCGDCHSKFHNK